LIRDSGQQGRQSLNIWNEYTYLTLSETPPPAKSGAEAFFDHLGDETKDVWSKFGPALKAGLTDVVMITIETQDQTNTTLYKTTISLDGSVLNVFQANKPDANDEYWKRHNANVDQAVQNRVQMLQKVIETAGGVVKLPF